MAEGKYSEDLSEFMAQEEDIINKFCDVIKEKGFYAEWFYNLQGEPTLAVHLKDEDCKEVKYFACFDVA